MASNSEKWSSPSFFLASLVVRRVKSLPTVWETRVWSLGREDPLEKGIATRSSILAWRIPRKEEPGGLQSMGLPRAGHNRGINTRPLCSFLDVPSHCHPQDVYLKKQLQLFRTQGDSIMSRNQDLKLLFSSLKQGWVLEISHGLNKQNWGGRWKPDPFCLLIFWDSDTPHCRQLQATHIKSLRKAADSSGPLETQACEQVCTLTTWR